MGGGKQPASEQSTRKEQAADAQKSRGAKTPPSGLTTPPSGSRESRSAPSGFRKATSPCACPQGNNCDCLLDEAGFVPERVFCFS